jgi:hypothetical protein
MKKFVETLFAPNTRTAFRNESRMKSSESPLRPLQSLKNDYFDYLTVSDFATILDLRHKGLRRKNALSRKDLEMATYLWPNYERASEHGGIPAQSGSYGRWYPNHFALALQMLLRSSNDGIVHPARYKKALFKQRRKLYSEAK